MRQWERPAKAILIALLWWLGLYFVWSSIGLRGTIGVCFIAWGYVESKFDMRGL